MFLSTILTFLALHTEEEVWPHRYANDVHLVTLILNIHGFVGLALIFFLANAPFLALFF